MEAVDARLQLRLDRLAQLLGVHLLERAAEVDLGLDAPCRAEEKLGLDGELFRADVEGVEASHGCGLRFRHRLPSVSRVCRHGRQRWLTAAVAAAEKT